jgi:hypothetical protein
LDSITIDNYSNIKKVKFVEQLNLTKMREILEVISNSDPDFLFKVGKLMKMNISEIISNHLMKGVNSIYITNNNLEHNEKERLLILSTCFLHLFKKLSEFQNILLSEFVLFNKNDGIFTESNKAIKNEMNKYIIDLIEQSFNSAVNETDLNSFIRIYSELEKCSKQYLSFMMIDQGSIFSKFESEFIFQFFEVKADTVRNAIEVEEWTNVNNCFNKFQHMLNFIIEEKFIQESQSEIQNKDELLEKFIKISSDSTLIEGVLSLNNSINHNKFKIINATIDLINFTFEAVKILTIFHISLRETIIYQFSKIISNFVHISKETIIDAEGVKKGKLKSISQKEISMLNSTLCIIKNIVSVFIREFSYDDNIVLVLNNLQQNIYKVTLSCREKMNELFQIM